MLMQQLAADAERILGDDLPPPMYDRKAVRWLVSIDVAGNALGIIPLGMDASGKHRGLPIEVPFVKRAFGIRPILLVDTPAYTFGPPANDKRAAEKHTAYMELLQECAKATGSPAVAAIARYLEALNPDDALPMEAASSDLITFEVAGRRPIEEDAVKSFWADHALGLAGVPTAQRTCTVCDTSAAIVEMPPVPVKGVPGPQPEMSLTGVNVVSGESYGLTRAENAGICHVCGERAGKALNALLRDRTHHVRVGPVVYIFWAREDIPFDVATFLWSPKAEDVKALLDSAVRGRPPVGVRQDEFYAAALSANGARVVVRKWVATTVPSAASSLARWFRLTGMIDPWGDEGRPLSTKALAASMYLKPEDITARASSALMAAALDRGALPADFLRAVLTRCRIPDSGAKRVSHAQAALIKAVLSSRTPGKEEHMSSLETQEENAAYLCGRLFAVIESVQYAALGRVNATVADKFFAAASTAPAMVFGRLIAGAQPHLAKLRKTREGAHWALQTRLEELATRIGPRFPKTLNVEQQGQFMLGYYHQRAAERASSKASREDKSNVFELEEGNTK